LRGQCGQSAVAGFECPLQADVRHTLQESFGGQWPIALAAGEQPFRGPSAGRVRNLQGEAGEWFAEPDGSLCQGQGDAAVVVDGNRVEAEDRQAGDPLAEEQHKHSGEARGRVLGPLTQQLLGQRVVVGARAVWRAGDEWRTRASNRPGDWLRAVPRRCPCRGTAGSPAGSCAHLWQW
jgi:hypothetical protein